jgi:dUTP pyrophosphatase
MNRVQVYMDPEALLPVRQTEGSVGYDLHSSLEDIIKSKTRKLVSTGLKISIPLGMYGRIAPRSSLACKKSVDVGAGVVDNDYRGEVKVLLINNGEEDFKIEKGDRIAQLIFENYSTPTLEVVSELDQTIRGQGGFGSTGGN